MHLLDGSGLERYGYFTLLVLGQSFLFLVTEDGFVEDGGVFRMGGRAGGLGGPGLSGLGFFGRLRKGRKGVTGEAEGEVGGRQGGETKEGAKG